MTPTFLKSTPHGFWLEKLMEVKKKSIIIIIIIPYVFSSLSSSKKIIFYFSPSPRSN